MARKFREFLFWITKNYKEFDIDFVMKLDDDSYLPLSLNAHFFRYLNINQLCSSLVYPWSVCLLIRRYIPSTRSRYGFFWYDVYKETEESKYYDTLYKLGNYYPPYAAGAGHIMSFDLVKFVTQIPNPVIVENDDVNVDIWVYPVDVSYLFKVAYF